MLKSLLGFTLLIIGVKLTDADCTLDRKTYYSEGEYWSPVIDERIGAACVNCSCLHGQVNCTRIECPVLKCNTPKYKNGGCCPVCEETISVKERALFYVDFTNIPPTVKPDNNGDSGQSEKGCVYHGKTYAPNEFFSNNETAIAPYKSNQCVECICQGGDVYCYLKTCHIPKNCRKLTKGDGCCPECLDDRTSNARNKGKLNKNDCTDTKGNVQPNGTTWHPVVHDEENKCVTCTCLAGNITCGRDCPDVSSLPCKKPRKRKGECCPSCKRRRKTKKKSKKRKGKGKNRCRKNKKRRQGKKNKKDDKRKKRRRRKDNKRRKRKSNKCINGTIDTSLISQKDVSCPVLLSSKQNIPCFLKNMCLPERTEYIVYRQLIGNHTAYMAFDHVESSQIEIWTWNVTKDKMSGRKKHKECHSDTFRNQISDVKAVLGAATDKSIRDFKRKLDRALIRCEKKKNGCRMRTVKRHLLCFELSKIDIPGKGKC